MSLYGVLKKRLNCCHQWLTIIPIEGTRLHFSYSIKKPVRKGIKPLVFSNNVSLRCFSLSTRNVGKFSKWTSVFKNKVEKEDESKQSSLHWSVKDKHSAVVQQVEDAVPDKTSSIFERFKLSSLLDKIPQSSTFYLSTPVSSVLKEHISEESKEKKLAVHSEILNSSAQFFKQYDKDLDVIMKRTTSPSQKKKRVRMSNPNDQKLAEKSQTVKGIQYPLSHMKRTQPVYLRSHDQTKKTLLSLGIPADELPYYPGVQAMTEDDILLSVNKLKSQGINMVFSLYLLEHIFIEKNLESLKSGRKSVKQRKSSIMSLKEVQAYKNLCLLLENPNLNIRHLLRQLAEKDHYLDIATLCKKVKKLRSVGATPSDILNNLEILQGYELFDDKIKIFSRIPHREHAPFPVQLFLAKSLATFKDQLGMGTEVDDISKLLGVSVADFQACWGYKHIKTRDLQYKIQMCLSAGISPQDLFNNLGLIQSFPVDKLYTVTSNLRNSGLPISVFVLQHMNEAHELNGNGNGSHNRNNSSNDVGTHSSHGKDDGQGMIGSTVKHEQDWTGEMMAITEGKSKIARSEKPFRWKKKMMISSKKKRRPIYSLIEFVLQLNSDSVTAMFECHINIENVDIMDIRKNLDHLLSRGFTREQIANCPLILAHQHKDLVAVIRKAEELILGHLYSTSAMAASPPQSSQQSPRSSLSELGKNVEEDQRNRDLEVKTALLNNPTYYLNTLQYLLEVNSSFYLSSLDSERRNGFLDV